MYGRYLDDFTEGEVIEHSLRKTVTESDNNFFCLLTMNHHQIHLDIEYARLSQHKQILVVGTYVFSLAVGLSVGDVSGKAIANLEYEEIVHHAPVFIGDTIHAVTKVLNVTPSLSKPDRGVVHVETNVYNQNDSIVLSFRRKVLIKKCCD